MQVKYEIRLLFLRQRLDYKEFGGKEAIPNSELHNTSNA